MLKNMASQRYYHLMRMKVLMSVLGCVLEKANGTKILSPFAVKCITHTDECLLSSLNPATIVSSTVLLK